jgi:hypothetical protein
MYAKLALMTAIHVVLMYFLVFAPVNTWGDIKLWNLRSLYLALIMAAPMPIVALTLMRSMYENRKYNMAIYTGSAAVFVLALLMIRGQTFVGDTQLIKSMIPHHSAAITMCREASLTDRELRGICSEIIESQQREIDEMNEILSRLPSPTHSQ